MEDPSMTSHMWVWGIPIYSHTLTTSNPLCKIPRQPGTEVGWTRLDCLFAYPQNRLGNITLALLTKRKEKKSKGGGVPCHSLVSVESEKTTPLLGEWQRSDDLVFYELDTPASRRLGICCWFSGFGTCSIRLLYFCWSLNSSRPSLARPLGNLLPWKEGIEIEYLQSKMIEFYS